MKTEKRFLTAADLIALIRLCDPRSIIIVDGIRDFVAISDVGLTVVWESEYDVFGEFTDQLTDGKPNSGTFALYFGSKRMKHSLLDK